MNQEFVTFQIDDRTFKLTMKTIAKSPFLEKMCTECWKKTEFITLDMSPKIFDEILTFLRHPEHKMPEECRSVLDYMLIPFEEHNFDNRLSLLEKKVSKLEIKLYEIIRLKNHSYPNGYPQGWTENADVNVYGRGWIPCSKLQVGDEIQTDFRYRSGSYFRVSEITRHKNIPVFSYRYGNIGFTEGIKIKSESEEFENIVDEKIYEWDHWMPQLGDIINIKLYGSTVLLNDSFVAQLP